jgi:1-aminocyclopropane-1-carboxylate deaminase/D-cysteine desulfhydrase-like pyridoxal-dependent ACC family enzyme
MRTDFVIPKSVTPTTPIERVKTRGRVVLVKRDDLYARAPAPPVAKLRGLERLIPRLRAEGIELVGCFEASVSSIGQGLAALCNGLPGIRCVVAYPFVRNRELTASLSNAKALGADLLPIPSNYVGICYAQARQLIEARGGYMIPFGFECEEAIAAIESEARTVPVRYLRGGALVACCGSGVTLAGLLRGLPILPTKVVGVSSGRSIPRLTACLARHCTNIPSVVELHAALLPYSSRAKCSCPFPCNPYYDLKAWQHLNDHLNEYPDPVLFWNIGA